MKLTGKTCHLMVEEPTMEVELADGLIVRRRFSFQNSNGRYVPSMIPHTNPGETIMYRMGMCPLIIKGKY